MSHWLLEKINATGKKTCIVYQDTTYSYSSLADRIKEYQAEILDIKPGSVVAILSDYSFNTIALFLALLNKQCIIVPISSQVKSEIEERIKEAFCDTILSFNANQSLKIHLQNNEVSESHQFINRLQEKRRAGLILFSSGTSGRPKAMIHDLNSLINEYRDKRAKNIKILAFLMFDHIGGQNTLFSTLAMEGTLILCEGREVEHICRLIRDHHVQILPTSPSFLNLILIAEGYRNFDLSSLRMITYGTEPMPEPLLLRLKELFPKVKFLQTFGTSETGISKSRSKSSASTFIKLDDPNIKHKIINGELLLKSKTQILGYLNAPMDSFTHDGWFKTGDLVEISDDGYLKIIGRNKEVINVGGEKVLPAEIEAVLLQIPTVIDCMVYGKKNAITGQIVVADIVVKNKGNPKKIKKEVRQFCKEKLDQFKIPTKINIVDKTNITDRFKKKRL